MAIAKGKTTPAASPEPASPTLRCKKSLRKLTKKELARAAPKITKTAKITKATKKELAVLATAALELIEQNALAAQPDCALCTEAFSITNEATSCDSDRCTTLFCAPCREKVLTKDFRCPFCRTKLPDATLKKSKWWDPNGAELEELRAATDVVFDGGHMEYRERGRRAAANVSGPPVEDAEGPHHGLPAVNPGPGLIEDAPSEPNAPAPDVESAAERLLEFFTSLEGADHQNAIYQAYAEERARQDQALENHAVAHAVNYAVNQAINHAIHGHAVDDHAVEWSR